jgi:amidophosphoribosyltransferase
MLLDINTRESAGMVSSTGKSMYEHKGMGLVPEIFDESVLNKLHGHIAIGHVRYSTTGSSSIRNTQRFPA